MNVCMYVYYIFRSGITHVPSSLELKRELLAELKRIKKPQKIDTDFGHAKNVIIDTVLYYMISVL